MAATQKDLGVMGGLLWGKREMRGNLEMRIKFR